MKKALVVVMAGLLAVALTLAGRSGQTSPPAFAVSSWQSIGPSGGNVIGIAANPQNAQELYAAAGATTTQILKSTDGGQTWAKISTVAATVYDIAVNPLNQNIFYLLNYGGIYKSTDRGLTWNFISFGSNNSTYGGKLGVNRSDGNTIYAPGYRSESSGGTYTYYIAVFKSTDGGASWTCQKLSSGLTSNPSVEALAVFPTNPNIVYVGAYYYTASAVYKVYKTTNGGNSWQDVTGSVYGMPNAIVIDPNNSNRVFVGTTGKVFRTSDGGATWAEHAGYAYANDLAVDPVNANILFGAYNKAVYKTTDGGQTWTTYTSGLLGNGNRVFVGAAGSAAPFAAAAAGGIFYASTAGVFRSTDGGQNWQDVSSGFSSNNAQAIGMSGSSQNKLFLECKGNDFFKTDNFGATWQRCASYAWCEGIKRILVNPNNANEIFILASG